MGFAAFEQLTRNRFRFNLFLLYKLPAAYISGVRLRNLSPDWASTTVPFKWLSQNPFRSTYFACQAMAAELSTGILAMAYTHQLTPSVSMLVTRVEGRFYKKASERLRFECHDGQRLKEAVETAAASGEPVSVVCTSKGYLTDGQIASEFFITWSFKARRSA